MQVKKGATEESKDFLKWFSELNRGSGKVAGGKGANLAEIYNLGVPVPPGFVITAQAYDYFIKKAGLNDKIKTLLEKINYEETAELDEITKKIRELIENSRLPMEMEEEILEAYKVLGTEDNEAKEHANHFLEDSSKNIFVAVRSSATTEDLADASFAGQQETFLNVKGKEQLVSSIKKCFASLFTSRATYYRNKKGFKHEKSSLAVVVQKMIDSDKSGVIFSKDPSRNREDVVIEAVWGLGEGIVSGKITPDSYLVSRKFQILEKEIGNKKIAITRGVSGDEEVVKLNEERSRQQVLKDHEIIKLAEIALRLETHYQKPQDIEFAIENNEIYIVQTRPITTLEKRSESSSLKELKGEVILKGMAASPGIGVGKVKIVHGVNDLGKIESGDILVTGMTNPDMVVTMQRCSAIVTDEGGLTAHAAIVSREMGIPAVVGTQHATEKLKDGEIVTVDGFNGKVYRGRVSENVQKEIKPVTHKTKTKLKVILDLPSFAERASRAGLKSVGLARIEGIIAESGKHPNYFLEKGKIKDYEEIIFQGIKKISDYFDNIWVRTSDIRSDEFHDLQGAPKEIEANPMLGMHGIRFSLKYPEILKAELNAMKRVSELGKTIGVMAPQIISVEEVKKLKAIIKEIGFTKAKIGVMVETPAAVQVIKEICDEGIDFISFGTNDLTQYILAIDRGNEQVQDLYDEMNPAVLYQLEFVIRTCKRKGVETSICGQSGSKKEMVKFLIEKGIDSISVNADVAADIAEYVSELEKTNGKRPEEKEDVDKEYPESQNNSNEEILSAEPYSSATDTNEELPMIPGAEYVKDQENKEETSSRLSQSKEETRPSDAELKEETLNIF
ncbi:MAG: phosphoenolpyruvate synthase [Nanoarchaeota archaeon]